jgi:hypothetical protein
VSRRDFEHRPAGREEHVHPQDDDGLGRLTGETIDWMDRRLAEFDDGLTGELRGVMSEGLYTGPEDGLTLGSAIFRLAVFHELKKTGVLTYEEFRGLKSRLLGL